MSAENEENVPTPPAAPKDPGVSKEAMRTLVAETQALKAKLAAMEAQLASAAQEKAPPKEGTKEDFTAARVAKAEADNKALLARLEAQSKEAERDRAQARQDRLNNELRAGISKYTSGPHADGLFYLLKSDPKYGVEMTEEGTPVLNITDEYGMVVRHPLHQGLEALKETDAFKAFMPSKVLPKASTAPVITGDNPFITVSSAQVSNSKRDFDKDHYIFG